MKLDDFKISNIHVHTHISRNNLFDEATQQAKKRYSMPILEVAQSEMLVQKIIRTIFGGLRECVCVCTSAKA